MKRLIKYLPQRRPTVLSTERTAATFNQSARVAEEQSKIICNAVKNKHAFCWAKPNRNVQQSASGVA